MNQPPSLSAVRTANLALRDARTEVQTLDDKIKSFKADHNSLVAEGLEDDLTLDKLSRVAARIELATSRRLKAALQVESAMLDLSEATFNAGEELVKWLQADLDRQRDEFSRVTCGFFIGGIESRAFQGDHNTSKQNCWSRKTFAETDAAKVNESRRVTAGRCQRHGSFPPPERRAEILEQSFGDIFG